MTQNTHTPGPWVFVPDEDIPGFREPDRVLIGKREYDVGGTANARLIAAAPELLAALEAINKYSNCSSSRETARAAIAKAKETK